jgi:hypothetical protein
MTKTFIIGTNNKFSLKTSRWLFFIMGLVFLLNGAINVYGRPLDTIGLILGIAQIAAGLFNVFYAWFGLSEKSRLSPKISIDEDKVVLKKSFWSNSSNIKWSDISEIEFKSFELVFNLNGGMERFDYIADSDTSIAVKQYLRDVAKSKNIEVIGG